MTDPKRPTQETLMRMHYVKQLLNQLDVGLVIMSTNGENTMQFVGTSENASELIAIFMSNEPEFYNIVINAVNMYRAKAN